MTKKKRIVLILAAVLILLAAAGWILAKTVIIPKTNDSRVQALLDSGDYEAAFALREKLSGKEAADALKREIAARLIEENDYYAAYALLESVGDEDAVSADVRRRAAELIEQEKYNTAYALLREIGDNDAVFADINRRLDEAIDAGNFDTAFDLLDEFGHEEDLYAGKCRLAEALIEAGESASALDLLKEIDSEDAVALLSVSQLQYAILRISAAQVGERVTFGSYEQDNDPANGSEPIEWIVAAKEGDRVQLLCAVALDCVQYNTKWTDVTWETCSLRAWLNETFLNEAFSPEEQSRILTTEVPAGPETDYGTSPGRDTTDKVFLLSVSELGDLSRSGLPGVKVAPATDYAAAQGAAVYSNGTASWWLRSPGAKQDMAAYFVYDDDMCGVVDSGMAVSWIYYAVRPVIWIDVSG